MANIEDVDKELARLRVEKENLRDALATAQDEHTRDLAGVVRQLDDAVEQVEDLATQLVTAERTIDELERQLEEARSDANELQAERDDAIEQVRQVEETIEREHHQTLAKMVEAHEREVVGVLDERDGAVAEARLAKAEAAKATRELEAERKMLDELLTESNAEVDRLMSERDTAADQAGDLAKQRRAAEAELHRLGDQFRVLEGQQKQQLDNLTDDRDKFMVELLKDHERDLAALAQQRDEALRQREVIAAQAAEAEREVAQAGQGLEDERSKAARLAQEREAAALELDKLAQEREASTRQAARQKARQDEVVAQLLDNHERELKSVLRQRDFARQEATNADRDIADLKVTIAHLVADRDDDQAQQLSSALRERDFAMQRAVSADRDIAELKVTIARLVADRD